MDKDLTFFKKYELPKWEEVDVVNEVYNYVIELKKRLCKRKLKEDNSFSPYVNNPDNIIGHNEGINCALQDIKYVFGEVE